MRPWLKPTIAKGWLILALCLGLLGLFSVHKTIIEVPPHPRYAEQLEAARLMERALSSIKDAKIKHGLPINQDEDPNQTGGLIGEMFTTITTSSGNLEAKRTGTSPRFCRSDGSPFRSGGSNQGGHGSDRSQWVVSRLDHRNPGRL